MLHGGVLRVVVKEERCTCTCTTTGSINKVYQHLLVTCDGIHSSIGAEQDPHGKRHTARSTAAFPYIYRMLLAHLQHTTHN